MEKNFNDAMAHFLAKSGNFITFKEIVQVSNYTDSMLGYSIELLKLAEEIEKICSRNSEYMFKL